MMWEDSNEMPEADAYEPVYPDGSLKNECWDSRQPVSRLRIRHAKATDAEALAALEAACFPPAEAASLAAFKQRVAAFADCFWLLEENGRLAACINGCASDEVDLRDEMFADAGLHKPDGKRLMLFGVMTLPVKQHRGLASILMREVIRETREKGRQEIVLTCKEKLIPFYSRFGYVDEGVSASEHGGAVWHSMRLVL